MDKNIFRIEVQNFGIATQLRENSHLPFELSKTIYNGLRVFLVVWRMLTILKGALFQPIIRSSVLVKLRKGAALYLDCLGDSQFLDFIFYFILYFYLGDPFLFSM